MPPSGRNSTARDATHLYFADGVNGGRVWRARLGDPRSVEAFAQPGLHMELVGDRVLLSVRDGIDVVRTGDRSRARLTTTPESPLDLAADASHVYFGVFRGKSILPRLCVEVPTRLLVDRGRVHVIDKLAGAVLALSEPR